MSEEDADLPPEIGDFDVALVFIVAFSPFIRGAVEMLIFRNLCVQREEEKHNHYRELRIKNFTLDNFADASWNFDQGFFDVCLKLIGFSKCGGIFLLLVRLLLTVITPIILLYIVADDFDVMNDTQKLFFAALGGIELLCVMVTFWFLIEYPGVFLVDISSSSLVSQAMYILCPEMALLTVFFELWEYLLQMSRFLVRTLVDDEDDVVGPKTPFCFRFNVLFWLIWYFGVFGSLFYNYFVDIHPAVWCVCGVYTLFALFISAYKCYQSKTQIKNNFLVKLLTKSDNSENWEGGEV